jgi:hypothetical protein
MLYQCRVSGFYQPCLNPASLLGLVSGYTLGVSLGVYLIGNIGDQTGVFADTFGGAIGGLLAGVILSIALEDIIPILTLPVIWSVIQFNSSRGYKTVTIKNAALLSLSRGAIAIGVPAVSANVHSMTNEVYVTVPVITIQF